ncbi:hypothetical protein LU683_22260 [Pseudomonas asiatica]|uniref:hypothetical protein n=1 Tax=Pseudomonas TaxID=286 RepID=UPI0006D3E98A|nr:MULTISPECIES: hypothetical protein [Pseudomonas]MCE0755606.1 hypothetical protein [Pseudomonas asiatica]MCE0981400.1 hypothetical protein [Pseudomonas monteilii]
MDHNPYSAQYEAAVAALAAAEVGLREQYELYGHLSRFDEAQAKLALKNAEVKLEELERESSELGGLTLIDRATVHEAVYRAHRSLLGQAFDAVTGRVPPPKKMSEAEEAKLAEKAARLDALICENGEIATQQHLVQRLRYDVQFHSTLDWLETDSDYATYSSQIARLQPAVESLAAKIARFEEHIRVPQAQCLKYRERLIVAKEKLAQAIIFRDDHRNAPPRSEEAAKVKGACSNYFGTDDIAQVVRHKTSDVEDLERELAKWEQRMASLRQRDSRVIERLIIDGSNLCNRGRGKNQQFIGLNALSALVPALLSNWPGSEIILVFDPGITRKLQVSWEDIQRTFPASVETYRVGRGRSADEMIIELAYSPNAYIISNDRFGEFSNRPAIKENRVFGHDITKANILVNELWISVEYCSPG